MGNSIPEFITGSRLIRILLKIGSTSELEPEERRKRISAVFILLIIMTGVAIFSFYHFYNGHYSVVAFDLSTFIIALSVLLYLRKREKAPLAYWIIGIGCILFFAGTTILGRIEISFFMWAFLLPAISFSILGEKKGLVLALIFFCTNLFLMTAPTSILDSPQYSPYMIVRFSIIYLILTFIIYYYESSQQMLIRYVQQERDKFENASKHDLLTGLSNRRDIIEKMENEQIRHARMGKPFAIIIGDLDNFKNLNDTYGHDSGDLVLKVIGRILKSQVRGIDCPARWGGEEFLIMLVETDIDGGQKVAERIRKKIENADFKYKDEKLSVTMTLGLSVYKKTDSHIDDCIKRADRCLYQGKSMGKNIVITD